MPRVIGQSKCSGCGKMFDVTEADKRRNKHLTFSEAVYSFMKAHPEYDYSEVVDSLLWKWMEGKCEPESEPRVSIVGVSAS